MNINTKAIITSTILTVLFAGTSAMATDDIHRFDFEDKVSVSESVHKQKISLKAPIIESYYNPIISAKK